MIMKFENTKPVIPLSFLDWIELWMPCSQMGFHCRRRISFCGCTERWIPRRASKVGLLTESMCCVQRLFKYIGGENEEKKKIEMTTPVRSLVTPSDGPFCESKFTVSFFVPYDLTVRIIRYRTPDSRCLDAGFSAKTVQF